MISVNKFIKKLDIIIFQMEHFNLRKVWSTSLHRTRKNNFKINKTFLKGLVSSLKGLDKINLTITDLPNNEARFIFKDLTEGNVIIDSINKQIILGAKI